MNSSVAVVDLARTWASPLAWVLFAASGPLAGVLGGNPCLADGEIRFSRDIRPILNDHCFACHGADSSARQADLRLDDRAVVIERGVVVPGRPSESPLIERIESADPATRMPPVDSPHQLTPAQKKLLRSWVEQGAEYEQHWAWQAPQRPALPAVSDPAWPRNAIDHFVMARLDESGLRPAPEAPLAALVRRASLDLTGLPPPPDELQGVLDDPRPDRYEQYIDRLLASPRWGEHRGRYWLDCARYADTHGLHFDNFREMWSYRDWVIGAFNRNLPFDSFTREQLAGDLLPDPTLEQLVATGFNRCNTTTNEGGAIDEEYLVLYTRDRVETVSAVWMGLTAGCAVCHDHKYDPLPQRDFYGLAAFFNNTTQAAMDGNRRDTPPTVLVPLPEDRTRYGELQLLQAEAGTKLDACTADGETRMREWLEKPSHRDLLVWHRPESIDSLVFHAGLDSGSERYLDVIDRGQPVRIPLAEAAQWQPGWSGPRAWQIRKQNQPAVPQACDFDQDQPFSLALWVKPAHPRQGGALVARMDRENAYRGWDCWLQNGQIGLHRIHQWPGNALKVVTRDPLPPDRWSHVVIVSDGSAKAAGVTIHVNGQAVAVDHERDSLNGSTRTAVPLRIGGREHGEDTDGALLNDLRIFESALSPAEAAEIHQWSRAAWLLTRDEESLEESERKERVEVWLSLFDSGFRGLKARLEELGRELRKIEERGTLALVMHERPEPASAWILHRGEYTQRGEQVFPGTPGFLPPMAAGLPRNRAGFAEWLLAPEHPLTARVTVNRFWQEVFGQGIVRSSGDFGTTGQLPSHPGLLDWMAVEFREQGWDVKRLFRSMLVSATYRQAAVAEAEKRQVDPDNRLLSRGPRFRMDAEMVRDLALATSGLLVDRIGGPSVRPYQPEGVWEAVAMPESDTRNYRPDSGDGLYRRSLYTFWKRSAPPASMDIFNAPSRETCTVVRERTNTPLQALVTLNDPQFIEAARVLASGLLEQLETGSTGEFPGDLGPVLLSRHFEPGELSILEDTLRFLRHEFSKNPEAAASLLAIGSAPPGFGSDRPAELAAWTILVNQVMNLDEVLNK